MNHITLTSALRFTAVVAALGLAACSKEDRLAQNTSPSYDSKATTPVVTPSPALDQSSLTAASTTSLDEFKSASFEKQSDFDKQLKAMSTKFEADASDLRANYDEAKASDSRRQAMTELKNSEADFKQKMSAVGTATSDTWNSVRSDTVAAWDRLQASYAKARAEK